MKSKRVNVNWREKAIELEAENKKLEKSLAEFKSECFKLNFKNIELKDQISKANEPKWTEKSHPLRDTFKKLKYMVDSFFADGPTKDHFELCINDIKMFTGFTPKKG